MPREKFRRDHRGNLYFNYNEPASESPTLISGTKQDTLIGNETVTPLPTGKGGQLVLVPIDDGGSAPTGGVKPLPYSDSNIEFDYGTATCPQLEAVINYIAGPAQALMTSQQAQQYYYARNNEAKAAWLSKNCKAASAGGGTKEPATDGTTSTPGPVTSSGSTDTTTSGGDTVIGQKDDSTTLNVGSIGISPTGATSIGGLGPGGSGSGGGSSSPGAAAKKKFNWWPVIILGAVVVIGIYVNRNKKIPIPK